MIQLSSKIMTHHSVMTSSLRFKTLKFDKFGYFLCDIEYDSRTDVFRDVISPIINQCYLRRLRLTQSVRQQRSASKRSELVLSKPKMKSMELLTSRFYTNLAINSFILGIRSV